jgi:hypothetical protein
MRFVRSRPFLCLAVVTILIGVLWHSPIIGSGATRDALAGVVSVIGAPFIGAMRLSTSLLDGSRLTPLLGLVLGIAPYLLADWLLARYRHRPPQPT